MGLKLTVNNKKSGTSPPLPFLHQPLLFGFIPPFSQKNFVRPKWLNFWKAVPAFHLIRGVPTMTSLAAPFLIIYLTYVYRSERKKNIWCDTAVIIQGFSEKQQSNVSWVKRGKWDCNLANMLLELLWHFG